VTTHFNPGDRFENTRSNRKGFVLFLSNTSLDMVVRFDGFAYNTVVPADPSTFRKLPAEAFRKLPTPASAMYNSLNPAYRAGWRDAIESVATGEYPDDYDEDVIFPADHDYSSYLD